MSRSRSTARSVTVSAAAALAAATLALSVVPARAATAPVSEPRVVVHFDVAAGQNAENITLDGGRAVVVSLDGSRQVVRVDATGTVRPVATLPAPTAPGASGSVTGVARASDGTLYVGYRAGTAELTGIWRITRTGAAPRRIAALPAGSFPNGMAITDRDRVLYVADSALGVVWRIPTAGGAAQLWASETALTPVSNIGANGVKVGGGAVWVSNTDRGLLLRIPIRPGGAAGAVQTAASGLPGIDDFAFTAQNNGVLAAINAERRVVLLRADGTRTTVLTAADGLQNPTSIAVSGDEIVVASAAYRTMRDPNLLLARIAGS